MPEFQERILVSLIHHLLVFLRFFREFSRKSNNFIPNHNIFFSHPPSEVLRCEVSEIFKSIQQWGSRNAGQLGWQTQAPGARTNAAKPPSPHRKPSRHVIGRRSSTNAPLSSRPNPIHSTTLNAAVGVPPAVLRFYTVRPPTFG